MIFSVRNKRDGEGKTSRLERSAIMGGRKAGEAKQSDWFLLVTGYFDWFQLGLPAGTINMDPSDAKHLGNVDGSFYQQLDLRFLSHQPKKLQACLPC